MTTAALFAAALALLPGWLLWFLQQARVYAVANRLNSPLTILFPSTVAGIAVGALVVVIAGFGFRAPFRDADPATGLAWSIGLAVAATLFLLPAAATYSDTLLVFPVVVLGGAASRRGARVSRILFGTVVALGAVILIAGDLANAAALLQPGASVALLAGLVGVGYALLPAPVFAVLAGQRIAPRASVSRSVGPGELDRFTHSRTRGAPGE
ncbi:MAG: hypothetical protein ACRDIY_10730 [Chloroflexota bacterium]